MLARLRDRALPLEPPYCLIEDREAGETLLFAEPRAIVAAHRVEEVAGAFAALQQAVSEGFFVAGSVAYECGYALEPRLAPLLRPRAEKPLLLFGVFDAPRPAP
jgi:para-aminobenzoate synthetase component 1